MNNTYYKNLDENFVQAVNLYKTEYTHSELLEMLKKGNIPQKQIAALKLTTVNSKDEAKILLDNLTGQDGKIREAVSLKLNEFIHNKDLAEYFVYPDSYKKFLYAVTDINANICRNVISVVRTLKKYDEFCTPFCINLTDLTKNLIAVVEKFDFQDGKYKVNKDAFRLYWCLETIYEVWDKIELPEMKLILDKCSKIGEYTIREKTAKILTREFLYDEQLLPIKFKLKNDKNYYVRRF